MCASNTGSICVGGNLWTSNTGNICKRKRGNISTRVILKAYVCEVICRRVIAEVCVFGNQWTSDTGSMV